jgi:hypothetical protein
MNRTSASLRAIIATTALAMLAAACGGSPASAGGSSSPGRAATPPSAVAYSECVRSHGIPNFPDPPSDGGIAKASAQQLGVSSSRLQTAQRACQHLIPATGGAVQQQEQQCFAARDCSPDVVRELLNVMLRFARCMRTHGVPDFPDPTTDPQGQPFFNVSAHGISDSMAHSPSFTAKLDDCQRQAGDFPYSFG